MTEFRSLVPGGFYGNGQNPGPDGTPHSVSERANNPGAINGAAWEKDFPGFVENVKYDGKNDTTVFETPEQGVAAYWELLRRYRAGGTTTLAGIINRYGGGQDYSEYANQVSTWIGIPSTATINLDDTIQLTDFAKGMWRYEAGRPTRLKDQQIAYGFKLARERLNAGQGQAVPPPPKPTMGGDLAANIIKAMAAARFTIDRGPQELNIVYVEGMNPDGTVNSHRKNAFDDTRFLIAFEDGKPKIVGAWEATTRPGTFWTEHPMDAHGAFHIALGQQICWTVGAYHGAPALAQSQKIRGTRDPDDTYERYGPVYVGDYGVHHHGGYDYPKDDLGRSSAGCLVGRSTQGHARFMALIKADPRQVKDPARLWTATVLTAAQVTAQANSKAAGPATGVVVGGGAVVAATHHFWDKIELWHIVGAAGLVLLGITAAVYFLRKR